MSQQRIEKLYFVTASANKFNDYQFLLGKYANLNWVRFHVEDPVTNDLSILIRRQVESAKKLLPHLPFLIEQTNLTIRTWGGLPGNITGLFIGSVGVEGICKMLESFEDRTAVVVTDLAYHAADGRVRVFRGELQGTIAREPIGHQVFGWDAIFIPDGYKRTFAQMPLEQRNAISTRALAVAQLYSTVLKEEEADLLLKNRIRLRQLMNRHFNKQELKSLCFELGIDEDELPDNVKSEQVQALILYAERHGLTDVLLSAVHEHRPKADWPLTI